MKITSLPVAVAEHTAAGEHLHFASTPSRSNAAIHQVARHYRGTQPEFTFSTSGFHSAAHLLAMLRLGGRYVSCFYGDNYPAPRPNPLYTRLARSGALLEHWPLAWYVGALRAGALGHTHAVVRYAGPTTLSAELSASGRLHLVPAPGDDQEPIALIRALRPDVTFVHAPVADVRGRVGFTAPYGEGLWSALAARTGVIATVEKILTSEQFDALPHALVLPEHRVLAVCQEPGGAHPQPLYAPPGLGLYGYTDDFAHYRLWREAAQRGDDLALTDSTRIDTPRPQARRPPAARPATPWAEHEDLSASRQPTPPSDAVFLLRAARLIADLVRTHGYRVLLAGIGQSFAACRLAGLLLRWEGRPTPIMVETGLYDIDCQLAGDYLLGHRAMSAAGRRTGIDDILETLACGADNRCLAVVGAAQIDPTGAINSTRLRDGTILVGSGGAHDLATAAAEVVVLTAFRASRLTSSVDYVTSPGRAVRHIVTDLGILRRPNTADRAWTFDQWTPPVTSHPPARTAAADAAPPDLSDCGWDPPPTVRGAAMTRPSRSELRAMQTLSLGAFAPCPTTQEPT